ncbi:MAG: tRNA pseudouridine(38-40) synthase TruA [Gemmatimonadaceae bacterium]|nr:tRNA pseudouridine(38-40) synthase TruA [Gemmatimonadaceae bacterium]
MESRTVQLVLQYDGALFAGWQRQPDARTVQGVIEDAMERLCGSHIAVLGAGRTDAGVHALGQAAGVRVPAKWTPPELRRALNAVLPPDVRVARAMAMRDDFHARYSALSRSYRYLVGTDTDAESPFRSRRELVWRRPIDRAMLDAAAALVTGDHCFRGFAVKGTAPATDDHRCVVTEAMWVEREGGLTFVVRANRFLHHMVRFLVGTMLDIAAGRRELAVMSRLLAADDNREVSPPAPSHGLYLESVEYPQALYLADA